MRERWFDYLALYRPMVEEDSLAYLALRDCDAILSPLSQSVCASMFVNEETYLVVSNLADADYSLQLREPWIDRQSGVASNHFTLKKNQIRFLRKQRKGNSI